MKKILSIIFAILVLVGASFAYADTLTVDGTSSLISTGNAAGSARTWTHTTGTGNNRILVACVELWQDVAGTGSISAATYAGVNMTLATTTRLGAMRAELWYQLGPPNGANTVSMTVSGTTDDRKFAAVDFTGADQTNPIHSKASNWVSGAAIGTTTNVTVPNTMLVDCLSHFGTQALTVGTGQTVIKSDVTGSTGMGSSYEATSTTGKVGTSWTFSGANDASYLEMAIAPSTITPTISVDATSSASGAGVTSLSWTHTLNSLNNTVIDISMGEKSTTARFATAVTVNGANAVAIASTTGSTDYTEDYYFIATTTVNAITLTYAGSATSIAAFATSLNGVNQTTPLDAHACTNGTTIATSENTAITTVSANDFIVDSVSAQTGTALVASSTQTSTTQFGPNGGKFAGSYKGPVITAGLTSMGWLWSGNNNYADCAAAYAPAPAVVVSVIPSLSIFGGTLIISGGTLYIP